ncbi:UDP-N-acetylglucosamine--N-acetylmuramyl-(pentapeptide) pyrophosphoryl-undecaprenol N-acetylglucosamine transferase [Edaphobacter lichenicola]|uniref:UDP-N-acetylglucosamine--N-acetylmuramyl-(Pentapeptide) pyrophosphoryl-undecaprenol N-acetylglucosamine transferase n=1 Tax=Tunturiibacter gelidiferens TaxID=3069689 RepID=A0ACC5NXZ1_9BACT|nr:UDP-N-acetylglucosamine--N-acetylmuramyl-(pentapeptide) pyrophosphoryl-undecaprenol N-acetylglucosamine transferase [Edaphobacter lichenicola]
MSELGQPLRVLIAGGGTGGHVIPALAIARELRDEHGAEMRFVGTARGLETRLVPEAGFPLELIRVGQLKNVSLATRVRTLADLPLGVVRCVELVRSFKPDVVVGVGGYASGPAMMAAILLQVPTLAFEPNAAPGLANRLVGRFVSAAAVNFEETRRYFRGATVTGIPVRREFFGIAPLPEAERARASSAGSISKDGLTSTRRLLVFGGSQGARVFNTVMPRIAKGLLEEVPGLRILHQTGKGQAESTEEAYGASGADPSRWKVAAYLDDMPRRFADADLILCRSGASTVAELAAAGRPAVLVPFPGAADDHQMKNAEAFARVGAAELRVQAADDLMEAFLLSDLSRLLLDAGRLAEMGRRVRGLAHPDAVRVIGQMVATLAGR